MSWSSEFPAGMVTPSLRPREGLHNDIKVMFELGSPGVNTCGAASVDQCMYSRNAANAAEQTSNHDSRHGLE